ncbi:ImpA family type VI secretion system protein [Kistimonas scapharcae]|uniref:type VI secretion system protein TssA n=1 Tax=Kistimonas scapharcae TaxID=1036133 RepID=UPI0031ED9B2D
MSETAVLDEISVGQLLQAISDTAPCGTSLKSDRRLFRPLRNSFNLAQTALRQLSQEPDPAEIEKRQDECLQHWRQLAEQIIQALSTQSKDIELTGWLVAAQVVLDPTLSGMANALSLLSGLFEQFSDQLFPQLPEEKLTGMAEEEASKAQLSCRLDALVPLLGETEGSGLLYMPLCLTPLIGDITYARYLSDERTGKLPAVKQQVSSYQEVERGIARLKLTNIRSSLNVLTALDKALMSQVHALGIRFPGFRFMTDLLEGYARAVSVITGITLPAAPVDVAEQVEKPDQASTSSCDQGQQPEIMKPDKKTGNTQTSLGDPETYTRDHAFRQLRALADYFRRTEPHSVVPYLLEKAIRWGYTPLPELLDELLLGHQNLKQQIFVQTGLDVDALAPLPEPETIAPISSPVEETGREGEAGMSESPVKQENAAVTTPGVVNGHVSSEQAPEKNTENTAEPTDDSSGLSW